MNNLEKIQELLREEFFDYVLVAIDSDDEVQNLYEIGRNDGKVSRHTGLRIKRIVGEMEAVKWCIFNNSLGEIEDE